MSDDSKELICGYSYDHTTNDLGEGHWECRECGAEGWDIEDDDETEETTK